MGRRDERSRSRRRSRSPRRHRSSERSRRRSRSASSSVERSSSRRQRSYSRSSSRGHSRSRHRHSRYHRSRRSSRSSSHDSRDRRRRSRSSSHRRRSRSPSHRRSHRGQSSRRERRRSPSPRREERRGDSKRRHESSHDRQDARRESLLSESEQKGRPKDCDPSPRVEEKHAKPVHSDRIADGTRSLEKTEVAEVKTQEPPDAERIEVVEREVEEPKLINKPPTTERTHEAARRVDTASSASVESTPASTPLSQPRAFSPAATTVAAPEHPAIKRRREVRLEAHRMCLKSAAATNKAQAKFEAKVNNVVLAEMWLDFVGKNLEDVGKRIELQDWKFKKIEEGMDLEELLRPPSVDEPESETLPSADDAPAT